LQTFGTKFTVDGRLKDDIDIVRIPCDRESNTCSVGVPAPGFALVFFNQESQQESSPEAIPTFATTAFTQTRNTAYIDPTDLAKSNGISGETRDKHLGSTSFGSSGASRFGENVALNVIVSWVLVAATLSGWRVIRI
jgi:hypothetical protein